MKYADRIKAWPRTQRRLTAVALLIALVAVTDGFIIPTVSTAIGSQDVWRLRARRELARDRGKAQIGSALQQSAEHYPEAPIWQVFYAASEPAKLAGKVEQDVRSIAAAANVFVKVQSAPRTDSDGMAGSHGVRVNASMTIQELRAFATALRSQTHYLRVVRLVVRAPIIQAPDQNPKLDVTLDVYGFEQGRHIP